MTRRARIDAIDILRGFVMVLMAIDHASEELNAGRVFTDSAMFYRSGTPLPFAQFMTRWISHLCAPTFVFLAGASLAMSVAARQKSGDSERAIDKHLAIRGVLLLLFEVLWMSWIFMKPGKVLFQVLYAIGASLLFMIVLRRLGDRALLALAAIILVGIELAAFLLGIVRVLDALPSALLLVPGFFANGSFVIAYPALPWLGIMCLGWVLGRRLVAWQEERRASRNLALAGGAALVVFLVLRGANAFGNMNLLREEHGSTLVQWLHVSKYPPSLTFVTLELGIMALLFSALLRLSSVPRLLEPLRTIGKTALFFYLLHIHALALVAWIFGIEGKLGLGATYAGGVGVVLALYPLCFVYGKYKAKNPRGLAQYV